MKIAICTPVYRDAHWQYVRSLTRMVLFSANSGLDVSYGIHPGHYIGAQRNELAGAAIEAGSDYLLWIDSDQSFPHDTLSRLLARGKDIIGPNIALRRTPTGPSAARFAPDGKPEPVWTRPEQAAANEIEEVDAIGMGLCLVSRKVFEAVDKPWFDHRGEDYRFCANAKLAGFKVWCDHGLSADIGHVHERVLGLADMAADRLIYQMTHKL